MSAEKNPGDGSDTRRSVCWSISKSFQNQYTKRFNSLDTERRRYLQGEQTYYSFKKWKLSADLMAKIWKLADVDNNNKLVCDEFILAMYLCQSAQKGLTISDKLKPDLIPPLFRDVMTMENDVLYYCAEQKNMGPDTDYEEYIRNLEDEVDFKKKKLCTVCFKLMDFSNFSRHLTGKCKQPKKTFPAHSLCPYCPKEGQISKRIDNLTSHLLKAHNIGSKGKKRHTESAAKRKREPERSESVQRYSKKFLRKANQKIQQRKPSVSVNEDDVPHDISIEVDVRNYDEQETNSKVLSLQKSLKQRDDEIQELKRKLEQSEETNKSNDRLADSLQNTKSEILRLKTSLEQRDDEIQELKRKLEQSEETNKSNERITQEIQDSQNRIKTLDNHIKSASKENTMFKQKVRKMDEICSILLDVAECNYMNTAAVKLDEISQLIDSSIDGAIKFKFHKIVANMVKGDDLLKLNHLIKALDIQHDEILRTDFNKIKDEMIKCGNTSASLRTYFCFCCMVLGVKEAATKKDVEAAEENFMIANRLKQMKKKKSKNVPLFTSLEVMGFGNDILKYQTRFAPKNDTL